MTGICQVFPCAMLGCHVSHRIFFSNREISNTRGEGKGLATTFVVVRTVVIAVVAIVVIVVAIVVTLSMARKNRNLDPGFRRLFT